MLQCKLVYGDGPNPIHQKVGLLVGQINICYLDNKTFVLFLFINNNKKTRLKYGLNTEFILPSLGYLLGQEYIPKIPLQKVSTNI